MRLEPITSPYINRCHCHLLTPLWQGWALLTPLWQGWARSHNLTTAFRNQGMNTYGWTLLCIHFLQSLSLLPDLSRASETNCTCWHPLRPAQQNKDGSLQCGRCATTAAPMFFRCSAVVCHHRDVLCNRCLVDHNSTGTSLGSMAELSRLFRAFLTHFLSFDFKNRCVCAHTAVDNKLVKTNEGYTLGVGGCLIKNVQAAFCVVDPLDPTDNVARSVDVSTKARILDALRHSLACILDAGATCHAAFGPQLLLSSPQEVCLTIELK